MGANAQTTVPTFTAGQVLTAAQMNDSARTGVPVFADTSARDAGFGGTGEKTLAEGQLCYLEDSNVVQYYDGSSWATVGPSAAGGLVTVKAETAFSNVANVTADGVFTSTYTNYRIVVRFQVASGTLSFQLRAATVNAGTNYTHQNISANAGTISGGRTTSASSAAIANNGGGAFWQLAVVELSGPELAEPTLYQSQALRQDGNYTTATIIQNYYGNHSDSTSYDGLNLLGTTANITGSYTIYGYAKA